MKRPAFLEAPTKRAARWAISRTRIHTPCKAPLYEQSLTGIIIRGGGGQESLFRTVRIPKPWPCCGSGTEMNSPEQPNVSSPGPYS